jgi:hypothetical protein
MTDTSDPFVANNIDSSLLAISKIRGVTETKYNNILASAVSERQAAITTALNKVNTSLTEFNRILATNTAHDVGIYNDIYIQAMDLAEAMSGANKLYDEARALQSTLNVNSSTITKNMLAGSSTAVSKPLQPTDIKVMDEDVVNNKSYTLDQMNNSIGASLGYTADQMLRGISKGGQTVIGLDSSNGKLSGAVDGLVSGILTMSNKGQITQEEYNNMATSYQSSLESGLQQYIAKTDQTKQALFELVTELASSKYSTPQSVMAASSALASKYPDLTPDMVDGVTQSYANYMNVAGGKPTYANDTSFAEMIASDVAANYVYRKLK